MLPARRAGAAVGLGPTASRRDAREGRGPPPEATEAAKSRSAEGDLLEGPGLDLEVRRRGDAELEAGNLDGYEAQLELLVQLDRVGVDRATEMLQVHELHGGIGGEQDDLDVVWDGDLRRHRDGRTGRGQA